METTEQEIEERLSTPGAMEVVQHPDPVLLKATNKIHFPLTWNVARLVENMFATMREKKGIGLAANQVGMPWRLAVLQVPGWDKLVLINPEITRQWGGMERSEEGCLSVESSGKRVPVWPPPVW